MFPFHYRSIGWVVGSITVIAGWLGTASGQEHWTRFRGPNGTGLAVDADLPATWEAADYAWTRELAGSGNSSPVIWGNRLFVTSTDPQSAALYVECLATDTGQPLWKQTFESTPYPMHRMNSFASGTPAVDERHLYIAYADPAHTWLVALDHDGNVVWKRDFGKWVSAHGFSMSPMVVEHRVILFNSQQAEGLRPGQEPGTSELIAVDAENGKDLWRTPLKADRACYAVPCVLETERGRKLIGCSQAEGFFQVDLETGKLESSEPVFQMRTVASPLLHGDFVYGSNGSGGGGNYLVAARRTETGWEQVFQINRNANYVPTALVVGDQLYLFGDKGIVSCVDATTGAPRWRERLSTEFSGSPVSNGKQVYIMDAGGTVFVLGTGPEFELRHQIDLGQPTRATPAIAGNRIYFRTDSRVLALGN